MPMQVELVSPEKILWSGEAEMVITRTVGGGDIAFLPGHAPFVGALGIGAMTIRPTDGADEHIAVHGGFVEVSGGPERGTTVTILSDVAEMQDHIDYDRAAKAKEEAESALRAEHDRANAAALARAEVRLEVSSR
ncbi:ATP synthase F1 subunit epsilon [Actinospongicola halichondriae]|uniref:ATP synthase F1 subunit epsilon n=1 Tax=Actinospongicola halichondriae TaxID=3236844 RepID=UPI003D576890